MTIQELAAELGITTKEVGQWLREGLPHRGTKESPIFDDESVAAWLVRTNRAEPDPERREPIVLHTAGEVAEHFGVSIVTVREWLAKGCPGRTGDKGKQNGHFPVVLISEWLAKYRAAAANPSEDGHAAEMAKLTRVRRETAELELAEKRGDLIDATEVAGAWVRHSAEIRAQLRQLPGLLIKALGNQVPAEAKRRARKAAQQQIDRICNQLAEALIKQAQTLAAADTDEEEASDGSN